MKIGWKIIKIIDDTVTLAEGEKDVVNDPNKIERIVKEDCSKLIVGLINKQRQIFLVVRFKL